MIRTTGSNRQKKSLSFGCARRAAALRRVIECVDPGGLGGGVGTHEGRRTRSCLYGRSDVLHRRVRSSDM